MTTLDRRNKPPPRVRFFRMRNRLGAKVGVGGAPGSEPGEVSQESLARAFDEMKKAEEDYLDWVRESLTELDTELKNAWEATGKERSKPFHKIGRIAHELKGQGGTFGCPLITTFGEMLNEFTKADVKIGDNVLEIVKAHIDVMRAVINDRIAGKGGQIGEELKIGLDMAIKKYSSPTVD